MSVTTNSKKLPVLYVPVGYDRPDEPIVASWNSEDRSKAEKFHDGICHWTVEPYIPAESLREKLTLANQQFVEVSKEIYATTSRAMKAQLKVELHRLSGRREVLRQLLRDVEEA